MTGTGDLAKMVPGFDFLQSLIKGAGAAVPGMGQWIAPTLDPQELDKRIAELRTVQFWLEQNARLLATTIQAMEVQRMTLSTFQSMNVPLADLGEALRIKTPPTYFSPPPPPPAPAPAPEPRADAAADKPAAGIIDPMQWWGALTQQFTEIATKAIKDAGIETARVSDAMAAAASPSASAKQTPAEKTAASKPASAPRKRST